MNWHLSRFCLYLLLFNLFRSLCFCSFVNVWAGCHKRKLIVFCCNGLGSETQYFLSSTLKLEPDRPASKWLGTLWLQGQFVRLRLVPARCFFEPHTHQTCYLPYVSYDPSTQLSGMLAMSANEVCRHYLAVRCVARPPEWRFTVVVALIKESLVIVSLEDLRCSLYILLEKLKGSCRFFFSKNWAVERLGTRILEEAFPALTCNN